MSSNEELMRMSRESLKDKWGPAIGTYLIYMILTSGIQGSSGISPLPGLISLIIAGPLALGSAYFALSIARNQEARIEQLFKGFNTFGTSLVAYLLILIYVVLFLILLIVPGIIKAISYSMTFYIIADDNSIKAADAMEQSKNMMEGHKMKFFNLCLNFLGLGLLCILTLGIGFLWLIPFIHVTVAKFYDDIKGTSLKK